MTSLEQRDYKITDLHVGDLIQLRWLGDRRVANREGGAWATVRREWRTTPQRQGQPPVLVVTCDSYGTTRRITIEHIQIVKRKVGHNVYESIAKRVQTTTGTRLAQSP